ncbi:MAG: hypothetical protein OXH34_07790, partial [Bacteroidetes bacterium]|nr:hypothetical protein [Bacteroidota bacterium]
ISVPGRRILTGLRVHDKMSDVIGMPLVKPVVPGTLELIVGQGDHVVQVGNTVPIVAVTPKRQYSHQAAPCGVKTAFDGRSPETIAGQPIVEQRIPLCQWTA